MMEIIDMENLIMFLRHFLLGIVLFPCFFKQVSYLNYLVVYIYFALIKSLNQWCSNSVL